MTGGPARKKWMTTKIAPPTTARNATSNVPTRTGRDISHHLASSRRAARTTRSGAAAHPYRAGKQTTALIVLLRGNGSQYLGSRMTKLSSSTSPAKGQRGLGRSRPSDSRGLAGSARNPGRERVNVIRPFRFFSLDLMVLQE